MFLPQNGTSYHLEANTISQSMSTSNRHLVYGLIIACIFTVFLRSWFRHRYPCLTISHLDDKEKNLIQVFHKAPKVEESLDYRVTLEHRLFRLKTKASQIRVKSSQLEGTLWSVWEKYVGILPPVVCDVITWYDDARNLERDVLIFTEKIAREQYLAQLVSLWASVPDSIEHYSL
ncbi:hypothetical protein WG66_013292 [Moniliophthora roreri]|nr:hypothetical protein WG66_013292 [Moniliophthora roreri]